MAAASNASLASPLADAKYAPILGNSHIDEALATISNLSGWTVALTVLALLVAYDQCKSDHFQHVYSNSTVSVLYTSAGHWLICCTRS